MTIPATHDRDSFLNEYNDTDTVPRYVTSSAGKGIQYILKDIYGPLYSRILDKACSRTRESGEFRLLEYGCGAGMNLLSILRILLSKRVNSFYAIGTDFSKALIEAAEKEKNQIVPPEYQEKVKFLEASNESLMDDLSKGLHKDKRDLYNSFDLIVGVNTFRYALRLNKQTECASDIANMLVPGGFSIMIDMNNKFPLFKSKFNERKSRPKTQTWLPTLDQYAEPFKAANLTIIEKKNFCWIPHSAGSVILMAARIISPLLNFLIPSYAMRSLVVAQKKDH